jgi:hypothetical protein
VFGESRIIAGSRSGTSSVKGPAVFLLDGIRAVDGELDPTAFDAGDILERNKMVVVLMAGIVFAARQLDAIALNAIDGADVTAIGADDFGIFLDV